MLPSTNPPLPKAKPPSILFDTPGCTQEGSTHLEVQMIHHWAPWPSTTPHRRPAPVAVAPGEAKVTGSVGHQRFPRRTTPTAWEVRLTSFTHHLLLIHFLWISVWQLLLAGIPFSYLLSYDWNLQNDITVSNTSPSELVLH